MTYYKYHVFFCTNQRDGGRACCQDFDAIEMRKYMKSVSKERGLSGPGGVRINTAGCLDRCELGPVIVVYPEDTWYTYVDKADLDEILEEHLINGNVVERLVLRQGKDNIEKAKGEDQP
jgi:(2Fe-2S) ferredoxin